MKAIKLDPISIRMVKKYNRRRWGYNLVIYGCWIVALGIFVRTWFGPLLNHPRQEIIQTCAALALFLFGAYVMDARERFSASWGRTHRTMWQ